MGRGQGLYTQGWKKGVMHAGGGCRVPHNKSLPGWAVRVLRRPPELFRVGPGSPTMGYHHQTCKAYPGMAGRGGKAQQTGSPAMGGERDSFVKVHQLRRLVRRGGGLPHHPLGIEECQHQPSKASSVPLAKGGRGPHQGSRASQRQRTKNPARWR